MKNLFLVTSALWSNEGIISPKHRFTQTINCLENLRNKLPDDIIILTDGSPNNISQDKIDSITKYVNGIVIWNKDEDLMKFASIGRKSEAEVIMLFKMLKILRENQDFRKFMPDVKRIFKYSARTILLDDFNLEAYNDLEGKYVFKKALPSWLPKERQQEVSEHLYITRFYSFCVSLIENYLNTLPKILDTIIDYGVDTEHLHFMCINKSKIIEFENLYCEGVLAGNGQTERY